MTMRQAIDYNDLLPAKRTVVARSGCPASNGNGIVRPGSCPAVSHAGKKHAVSLLVISGHSAMAALLLTTDLKRRTGKPAFGCALMSPRPDLPPRQHAEAQIGAGAMIAIAGPAGRRRPFPLLGLQSGQVDAES